MSVTQPSGLAAEMFSLEGDVVLVTGAAGHLGRAISITLAGLGATVLLNGRDSGRLDDLAQDIRSRDCECAVRAFDVSDSEQSRVALNQISDEYGRLDGIVHNAYSGLPGSLETADPERFRQAFAVNASGPALLTLHALDLLRASSAVRTGGASVVHVASMYGHVSPDPRVYEDSGSNNPPEYGASKAALLQLTRYLACYLAPENIRVNSVSPGPFPKKTDNSEQVSFAKRLAKRVPLGRTGAAEEVAGPIAFLLSRAASYVTGADLRVDGGWTAW